jgi:hypothetical protein
MSLHSRLKRVEKALQQAGALIEQQTGSDDADVRDERQTILFQEAWQAWCDWVEANASRAEMDSLIRYLDRLKASADLDWQDEDLQRAALLDCRSPSALTAPLYRGFEERYLDFMPSRVASLLFGVESNRLELEGKSGTPEWYALLKREGELYATPRDIERARRYYYEHGNVNEYCLHGQGVLPECRRDY